ncbi:acyl-CoA dehydrogenase [Halopelagius longus]|uniref:Acyl-CoA dehydrogenase n=1 Tax=Halopelagius longus TaxID=1236180 RepID=A0A1H0XRS5_9EURY|nr:acyl-CoA dehydrogenase [Halopelagius longus]RDI72045.1 acyl-CoA dehydrogenase [Halopelagius longus]SDQ05590.1 hypothetical protein SAMN05216278_0132 [Halopelagius longus]
MSGTVRDYLADAYNPTIRGSAILLSTSGFVLFVFLGSPDFTDPYYLFGLGTTILAVISAVIMLVSVRMERR